MDVKGCCSVLG